MSSNPKPSGELMNYLPSVFHGDPFLAEYLSAFEQILVGSNDPRLRSLEATIAGIARYFDPREAPKEFLPWLRGWMALGMRADLPVGVQREFLAQIISLYKKRGTPESLRKLLKIFTGGEPTILEGDDLADQTHPAWSYWNVDDGYKKWNGGFDDVSKRRDDDRPEHAFGVLLSFMDDKGGGDRTAPEIKRKLAIAYALIELEKPAHTIFYLVPVFPSLRLPDFSAEGRKAGQTDSKAHSRIGFDTLLGVRP